jgi:hypothetical protein
MFSLIRYAPQYHTEHQAGAAIQVQGQLPNPMTIAEGQRLATELKKVLGEDWPFATPQATAQEGREPATGEPEVVEDATHGAGAAKVSAVDGSATE